MKLKIFFSWQTASDTEHLHNKPFILSCIGKAVGEIANKGQLKGVWFEVQEGTTHVAGTPEMIATCESRIDECHIFIADFTVERRFDSSEMELLTREGKQLREDQNTNVAYEFGRASHRLPIEQIITVMNTVNGSPEEDDKRFLAIDFRHRRWPITFHLSRDKGEADTDEAYDKAEKGLVKGLKTAIQTSALAAIEHMDEQVKPFMRWEVQRRGTSFGGKFFWNGQLQAVKSQILENKKVLRLLGLSGMGKTHLVNEAFGEDDLLKTHYLYIDCYSHDFNDFRAKLDWLFTNYREAYLVFDNCDQGLHRKIINCRRELQGSNPIITVYNDPLEESSDDSTTSLRLDRAYDDVVEHILSELPSPNSQVDLDKIRDFSGGVPMIARLLVAGIKNEQGSGLITDASLMDKILGVKKGSEERAVLQALSLFNFVGYRDKHADQMAFIAKHRLIAAITGDDERRVAVFDRTIQSYLQRGIIEVKGRLVGVRPTPIALYLFREWLATCSPDSLYQILKDIQASPFAYPLTEGFCAQFRYMGKSAHARRLAVEVAGPTSRLARIEELASPQGSRLFRSFVEVDSEVVAQTLETVIGATTTRELEQLSEGHSNIIWTIEKLCFEPSTFKRGVQMMLRMAMAEGGSKKYGALDRFIGLFAVDLPATAVSLRDRLLFLTTLLKHPDQHPFLLKAIACALGAEKYYYSSEARVRGLERLVNYQPPSKEEIEGYLRGCLDILMQIVMRDTQQKQYGCEIVSHRLEEWAKLGYGGLIWPYVLDLAEYLDYDWDEMCDALRKMISRWNRQLPEEFLSECKALESKLTKTDFASRYAGVRKLYRFGLPYEVRIEKEKSDYIALAKEMAKGHFYTVEMLTSIYSVESAWSSQFGGTLAESLSESDQRTFVLNSIEALNTLEKGDTRILIDFLRVVGVELFEWSWREMKRLTCKSVLFVSIALRGYDLDSPYVEELFQMVRDGIVGVEEFARFYGCYYPKRASVNEERFELLKRISQLPNSLPVVLELSDSRLDEEQGKDSLTDFLEDLLLTRMSQFLDCKDKDLLWSTVAELLRRGCSSKFASEISKALVIDSSSWGHISYGEHECISLLFVDYIDEAWPIFSMALLRQRGETLILKCNPHFSPFRIAEVCETLFRNPENEAKVLQWCDEYRDEAPKRLMAMLPLYQGEGNRFSDFVMKLIDRYGNQKEVLSSLSCNMASFSWMGSCVPYYEKRLACLSPLMEHSIEAVRVWARRELQDLKMEIEKEKAGDAERSAYFG